MGEGGLEPEADEPVVVLSLAPNRLRNECRHSEDDGTWLPSRGKTGLLGCCSMFTHCGVCFCCPSNITEVSAIDLGRTSRAAIFLEASRAAIFLEAMMPFMCTESRLLPIDLEYLMSLAREDVLLWLLQCADTR